MQPPKGHYRKLLPANLSHVRIAFANAPMQYVYRIDSTPVLAALDASDDEYAKYYADGLRSGALLAITEQQDNKIWAPGELFFKS